MMVEIMLRSQNIFGEGISIIFLTFLRVCPQPVTNICVYTVVITTNIDGCNLSDQGLGLRCTERRRFEPICASYFLSELLVVHLDGPYTPWVPTIHPTPFTPLSSSQLELRFMNENIASARPYTKPSRQLFNVIVFYP